jgi:hypothetical protein
MQIELAVEQAVGRRRETAAEENEETDGGGKDEPDGAKARRAEVAQSGK